MENTDKEFIMAYCRDRRQGYPFVFEKNYGLDMKVPNHPEYFVQAPRDQTVKVEITTWRGTSWNAIHFYGRIIAPAPNLCQIGSDGQVYSVGGFICKEWSEMSPADKKFVNEKYEIEIVRPLTQKEIDEDPDRWHGYEAGIETNAFYSPSEIFAIAKKIIKARFPGWEMEVDDMTD